MLVLDGEMESGPSRGVGSPRLRFGERACCLIREITETEGGILQETLGWWLEGS